MHTNLISRLIHATIPVPGCGGRGVIGEETKKLPKMFSVILG